MSLEQNIAELNTNIKALIAALAAAGTVTAASTGTAADAGETKTTGKTTGKGAKTDTKPKGPTVEEMQAAVNEVKEKFGTAEAKAIIEGAGGVKKMAEIPEAKYKAVFDAAKAKLEGGDDDTGGDDDI